MVFALVNGAHITSYLTCLVTEFLGTPAPATMAGKKQDDATAAGRGRQPTKNPSIPSLCASMVREFNWLHPEMNVVEFSKTDLKYHCSVVGGKGECTHFGLLGRCMEICPYKHETCTIPDDRQCSIKEALDQGLAKLAKNHCPDSPARHLSWASGIHHSNPHYLLNIP
jgi:hypothetical protein